MMLYILTVNNSHTVKAAIILQFNCGNGFNTKIRTAKNYFDIVSIVHRTEINL